jgi:hypothetical protein
MPLVEKIDKTNIKSTESSKPSETKVSKGSKGFISKQYIKNYIKYETVYGPDTTMMQ